MSHSVLLPIDAVLEPLRAALRVGNCAVLVAPPGAGKTTRVPLALLEEDWLGGAKLLLLSPRRIAARAAAARMASLSGEAVGRTIGYRLRLESRVSAHTRIEVITQGVFTRMILQDPTLQGIGAILFDEFHERALDADLGLALAMDAQAGLRPDLRLLVMSATLDGAKIAQLLDDCPVIESVGRMHPVLTRYVGRDVRAPVEEQMVAAVRRALRDETGSILCFLPGAREIERCARALQSAIGADVDVRPLYGALEPAAQDDAIAPALPGRRKIVLASAIAESSLTIEGVRVVIDCGLTRRGVFEVSSGLSSLETVRASRASIEQRRGRAGRLGPGVCWRLWDEPETRALAAFDPPEILGADLSPLVLSLADWGVTESAQLRWLDPPPRPAWDAARAELESLGALDAEGRITGHGARLAGMPVPPRLAHMIARAASADLAGLAGEVAVLLSEQGLGGTEIDLRGRVEALRRLPGARGQAARDLAARLAHASGGAARNEQRDVQAIGTVLALAFPGRIAMARREQSGEYLLANGRGAALRVDDALAKERFLVVAELMGHMQKGRILAAAPISEAHMLALYPDAAQTRLSMAFDAETKRVRGRRVRMLGAITLAQAPTEITGGQDLASAWRQAVRDFGFGCLPSGGPRLEHLRARAALLQRLDPTLAWPDWSEAALRASLDFWLTPSVAAALQEGSGADDALCAALLDGLDWQQSQALEREAPARFASPAGGSAAIDYLAEGGPAVEIRLQELFGLTVHPTIASGRVRLVLRLLSPAQRPVQITEDLPGFWKGSYAQVRADLRGRYPRHSWPEDPLQAEPTRRAKPRGG